MFSTFMAHARNRRQEEDNSETFTTTDNLNNAYSEELGSSHRSRRVAETGGKVIVTGSVLGPSDASSERSPKLGINRGHSQTLSTSTSTPTSTSTINPIRRQIPGSGRSDPARATSAEWNDEMNPHSNSRRRKLYPPVQGHESAKSNLLLNERGKVPELTMFERPQSRAEHRPEDILATDAPPEVVRLDSTGTDNGLDMRYDSSFQHNHSYPYPTPDKIDSNRYMPNLHPPRRQSKPPRPPKSQKRQRYIYSQRSAQGSQSNPSLDDSRPTGRSATSQEYLTPSPDQTRSNSQNHSEADFYASAVEDLEAETEESTSDYNSDNNGSPFASVLDSFPLPARSVTSTSSSSRSGSGLSSSASAGPSAVGGNSMTKKRWGLRVHVQQMQKQGMIGGQGASGSGHAPLHTVNKGNTTGSETLFSGSNLIGQRQVGPVSVPIDSSSMVASGDMDPDVYKHHNYAFMHPSLKPLSPIAEQDYMSPSPNSSKEENRSFRGWVRSGSMNVLTSTAEKSRNRENSHADGEDRVSIRTSVRTESVGSAGGVAMSRAGSGGAADGIGIHNKTTGPDTHRPFITRQLNRTASQTSSKSWTESVAAQPTPTMTPTHSSAQPSPRIEGLVPSHVHGIGRAITTHLPMRVGDSNKNGMVDAVHTPSSVGVTPISTTYSPTSTLQQGLINGASLPTAIQPPPGAIVANTPAAPTSHWNQGTSGDEGRPGAILQLPTIPALDLRFSMLESVTPRNSKRVDKMPVIPGSVEGHRGEEYDEYEEEYERHSLHADSFVTAGEEGERVELDSMNEVGEDLFIHRRWDRDAELGSGAPISSEDCPTFRPKSDFAPMSSFTPAFWTFWLGFLFPVLWLVGGWHFTNRGEIPPKYTVWEWFFWKKGWRPRRWLKAIQECFKPRPKRRMRRTDSSGSNANARAGKVYPALPRWVAEKQSTDDGRMRLNDPKRSLRGIQFGYPFIPRYGSGHHMPPSFGRFLTAPNRVLDHLYGVQVREVRGRPETGRRMLDPWIQRCRYAFCYALLLLAVGLCTASIYLIIANTRNLR